MSEKYDRMREALIAACDKAIQERKEILPANNSSCPLGIYFQIEANTNTSVLRKRTQQVFDLLPNETMAFMAGFDFGKCDCSVCVENPEANALGVELRAKYFAPRKNCS